MTASKPHPQRCETCQHREIVHNYGLNTDRPRCKITKWFLDACLRQIAYDARTGTFDIDKVVTGISKEKRDIVRVIKDAIRDIGGEGRRAGIDQVIDAVSGKGFAREKVKEGIDMLLRRGEAMEPKNGIIQLI